MTTLPFSREAELVVGLAATALPFAGTPEEEAARWLRLLRVHGTTAHVLAKLGVEEVEEAPPFVTTPAKPPPPGERETDQNAAAAIALIGSLARAKARQRKGRKVTTNDLLLAALDYYGEPLARLLTRSGASAGALANLLAEEDETADG